MTHQQATIAYPCQPVPFVQISIQDAFWLPRLETNRRVKIPYDFQKCEETDRIDNGRQVLNIVLPDDRALTAEHRPDLLNGVTVVTGEGFMAIPYLLGPIAASARWPSGSRERLPDRGRSICALGLKG